MSTSPRGVGSLDARIAAASAAVSPSVVAWRRDVHQHPELGNREHRTAALVAAHLRALGLDEVHTGIAHTGVVGLLKGGKPGPVVALRADMDALPVVEEVDLPFASKVRTTWNGQDVGAMHACGHDLHVAILMGVASVLTELRGELAGTVKFIFQPAEEMPPEGEDGGAKLMIDEGVLENPAPGAIFGLHVTSALPVSVVGVRPGPAMASSDYFGITVRGRQTHGAMPWRGVDPIVTSAQIVLGLQTLISRETDLTREPAVLTVGMIHGGVRENIVPDEVQMRGTIRTFDEDMRDDLHERVATLAEAIARGARAHCDVCVRKNYPVTVNDPILTATMRPTLERIAGAGQLVDMPKIMGAEDFSFFQQRLPGLYFFVGVTPHGTDPMEAAPNHSPRFFADEGCLDTGVRLLAGVACDWLALNAAGPGTHGPTRAG